MNYLRNYFLVLSAAEAEDHHHDRLDHYEAEGESGAVSKASGQSVKNLDQEYECEDGGSDRNTHKDH